MADTVDQSAIDAIPDDVLSAAVDAARAAAAEAAGDEPVGEHLGVDVDGPGTVTHRFAGDKPGYRGWYWSVSLGRAPASDDVTVNDVLLLPGEEAIVAPAWTPYKDRIRPGDLSPGDVLPPEDDDLRLVPTWSAGDGEEQTPDRFFAREVGLGRERTMSFEGRELAADRWHAGDLGPDAPIAQQAAGVCGSCGFLVSLAGPLADRFGVCGNGQANADGRVVSIQHGCGAHSAAKHKRSASAPALPPPVVDTMLPDEVEEIVVEPEPEETAEVEVVEAADQPAPIDESISEPDATDTVSDATDTVSDEDGTVSDEMDTASDED